MREGVEFIPVFLAAEEALDEVLLLFTALLRELFAVDVLLS